MIIIILIEGNFSQVSYNEHYQADHSGLIQRRAEQRTIEKNNLLGFPSVQSKKTQ